MGKAVTIVDIATKVGVSAKTVSRVVNGDRNVSQRVRDAVSAAIAELGYQPNLAARALVSSRSFTIGLLTPNIESTYFQMVHSHVSTACRKIHHHVVAEKIIATAPSLVDDLRDLIREVRLAGVVLTSGVADFPEVTNFFDVVGVRWVAFGSQAPSVHGAAVHAQEDVGEVMLADHLWGLGHRRIAVMRADRPDVQRGYAFAARLSELGANTSIVTWLDFDPFVPPLEIGRQAALRVLEMEMRPTAVFAFNDDVAAGLISALLTRNVSVPGEISVVGFDDSPIAKAIWPALTTIQQPLAEMAEAAVNMLVGEPSEPAPQCSCPVQLMIRETTGPRPY